MGRSLRPLVAAVVAIAAALALALYLFNGGDGDEGWQTLNDDASGIRLSYPREWEVQQVGFYCRRDGPGLLISNLGGYTFPNVEIPKGCTNDWQVSGLPKPYVLVDVSLFASPFPRTRDQPETTMPLELDRFERPPERPDYAFAHVTRGGNDYIVRAWFGPRAPREDQDAVAGVIRSIEFGTPSSSQS